MKLQKFYEKKYEVIQGFKNILSISYKLLVSNDTLTVFPSYMGIGVILVI